jgi:hypothetical protein
MLTRGHAVPRFHTKNLINSTFQNLLPEQHIKDALFCSYNTNWTIQSIFTVSVVNQQDYSVL